MEKERLWSKEFCIVIFLNFAVYLTHLMILSTFPFFVNYLGYTESVSGMCVTLFALVAVLSRPVIGWVLDNGYRRAVLMAGLCVLAVLPLGYLLIYTVLSSIVLTVMLRLVHGLAYASGNTAATTIASDMVPKSRFAEGMGMFGMSTALGTACAPSLGEALMNIGFPVLYLVTTGITLFSLFLFLVAKTPSPVVEKKPLSLRDLLNPDAIPASAVALLFVFTYGAQESYILKFATITDSITISGGVYFLIMAAMLLVARISIGRIADQKGEALFLYISCPMMTLALLLLAFVPGNLTLLIAGAMSGFSFGCIEPSLQTMAVSLATPDRRGAANSTFLCSFDIGIGVGGGLAGVLIDAAGYGTMFMVISVFSMLSLVVYLVIGRNHPSSISKKLRDSRKRT